MRTKEQTQDQELVMKGIKGSGVLDFVANWYIKSAQYIQNTKIKVAFVSTNSITQGEQVGILWNEMFKKYGIKIHFAHRTFQWNSEAKGKAAVHVVIIGFGAFNIEDKYLFEYENIKGEPDKINATNISPYLVESGDIVVLPRSKPLNKVPAIVFGSMPNDGGNLLLDKDQKIEVINKEPTLEKYIKPLISAFEYLNGRERFCFWLLDSNPEDINNSEILKKVISAVKEYRLNSDREATRKLADYPGLFGEIRQPKTEYVLIPKTSSENRLYIPASFFNSSYIASDSCLIVPNATNYHYGIIQSQMHMSWMRTVAGRLKSDYRYSNKLVYNNFPWPTSPSEKQKSLVEKNAQIVLDTRKEFPNATLADLYNPLTMPPKLLKAHKELDLAVDKCYRSKPFKNERERIEFLFDLYQELTK